MRKAEVNIFYSEVEKKKKKSFFDTCMVLRAITRCFL